MASSASAAKRLTSSGLLPLSPEDQERTGGYRDGAAAPGAAGSQSKGQSPASFSSSPGDFAAAGLRMVIGRHGRATVERLPRSGGPAPILDEKGQNVPRVELPTLGKRHYRVRSQIRDRLRMWQRQGLSLWWMTLTSSPESPPDRLRQDFQAWRKRLARDLEVDPSEVAYVMVDTTEGHGVLHFIAALPAGVSWLSYRRLGEWWQEIHGARQVKFRELRKGDGTARRLSQYIVSQYMVRQGAVVDALGRVSGSRLGVRLAELRRVVQRVCVSPARVYAEAHRLAAAGESNPDEAIRLARSACWRLFREAWDSLLLRSTFKAWDETWLLCPASRQLEPL